MDAKIFGNYIAARRKELGMTRQIWQRKSM